MAATLAAAAFLYWKAAHLPPSILLGYPGDGFFPKISLAVILIFGSLLLVSTFFASDAEAAHTPENAEEADENSSGPIKFDLVEASLILGVSLAYMSLLRPLGLEIATTIFMFVLLFPRLLMPAPKAAAVALGGALITMVLVYFAFVIGLNVPLPLKFLPVFLGEY
ncbi:tripartite tricarboxylate transporter TctB family protein [Parasedimentitalea psychrophila]|uniref:Tripartite tricarboxylate transporter TctB family protein n=1 Tax=Parasedimentitalea psychrophila TaxID=2997337 RepID=A0A9Y2P417_9RHOB|nr:tripartite tricarboxylate transporter TctB family protein [Parasedimentitalea psychrophila]WIY26567.1 tripartite tricarboxylate transporter TctB family protein [Parasedimentitalea psychrophila]